MSAETDRAESIRRNLESAREEQRKRGEVAERPTILDSPPPVRWDLERET